MKRSQGSRRLGALANPRGIGFLVDFRRLNSPLVALAVLSTMLAGVPAVSEAAFPGRNGRLAAVRLDDPDCHYLGPASDVPACAIRASLLTIGADGHDKRALISWTEENTVLGGPPAYSPDGKRLAYTDSGRLIIAGAEGLGPRVLTLPAGLLASGPQWSPGGGRLVFVGFAQDSTGAWPHDAYITRVDGRGTRRLTTRGTVSAVTWSSRGELAFEDRSPSANAIYVRHRPVFSRIMSLNPRTGAVHQLTRGPASSDHAGAPDWSPDGTQVVFESNELHGAQAQFTRGLYVLDVRTRRMRRVYRATLALQNPVWSPDGSKIAFVEPPSVKVTSNRGGAVRTLLRPPADLAGFIYFSRPSWQPL
jgi:Tol biopolymer transport system component